VHHHLATAAAASGHSHVVSLLIALGVLWFILHVFRKRPNRDR
jgi:hypothetical protein